MRILVVIALVVMSASLKTGGAMQTGGARPPQPGSAQPPGVTTFDASLFRELRWRHIGPFRGGRTKAAAGIAAQQNVFYVGAVNGGVWKTTD